MLVYVGCFTACSEVCAIDTLDPCPCGTVDDVIWCCVERIPRRVHDNLYFCEGVEVGLVEFYLTAEVVEFA